MSARRLYMAAWVEHPWDDHEPDAEGIYPADYLDYQEPEPAGWREYALQAWPDGPREGEHWPNGHKPFFWPKTGVPYRSRSSAQSRVDIINRWGGNAVLLECTPVWETVESANAGRERRRIHARIMKLQDALAAERAKFEATS